ncbi:MAG: hypothetical protein L0H93_07385 [Nocardioides sp.]|nr:hypothetical protein [Nocardioides sp.]
MSWIGLLLIGLGLTDLAFSVRPRTFLAGATGAVSVLLLGLLADLTTVADLVALVLIAVVAFLWSPAVTRGLGGGSPAMPLILAGVALSLVLVLSVYAGAGGGAFGRWLDGVPLGALRGMEVDEALLLLGAVAIQMSTGNVLVRLVLAATGTLNPARHGTRGDPEVQLKGGRLLGPMERLFILCLGLAGQLTAASIVVAAKGLLRFPELTSRREQERIHQLTEYFLVGSFVSWSVALSALVLLAS